MPTNAEIKSVDEHKLSAFIGKVVEDFGASTLCCTANSLALGGPALGAVATEKALREVGDGRWIQFFSPGYSNSFQPNF